MNDPAPVPRLKAVIFDFDGTIIDTETPVFRSWQAVYQEYGVELALDEYALCIGTNNDVFNPETTLDSRAKRVVDWEEVTPRRRAHHVDLVSRESIRPGVGELIVAAQDGGLRLAIGSSSPREWIDRTMPLPELTNVFDAIVTSDDAPVKPSPDIFRIALERLGVDASEAVVIEDSPNGALAAHRAGIFCLTVPNAITRSLRFEHGDMRVESLAEVTLSQIHDAHGRYQSGLNS